MTDFGVIVFRTNTAAVRAEKLLVRAALDVRLVPVLRELSNACGVAVRFPWSHSLSAQTVLREAGLTVDEIHRLASAPDPGS